MKLGRLITMSVTIMGLGLAFAYPEFRPSHTVKPSVIVPDYRGATVAKWTMDYQSALDNAADAGSYTLMMFSGMWWCPYCQALEEKVLTTPEFNRYLTENGYYTTVLDFPYRDGGSDWCWLWDPWYRESVAGLSPEEAADHIIGSYAVQNAYSAHMMSQIATNYVVTCDGGQTNFTVYAECPISQYDRIGYPTVILIDPYGNVVKSFSWDFRNTDRGTACAQVIDELEKAKIESKPRICNDDDSASSLLSARKYAGWIKGASSAKMSGLVSVVAGKMDRHGQARISLSVKTSSGTVSANGRVMYDASGWYDIQSSRLRARLFVGERSIAGTCNIQGVDYDISCGVACTKTDIVGSWGVVVQSSEAQGAASCGFGGLSVQVKRNGTAKFSGFLGDGKRISKTISAASADDGRIVLPFHIAPYGRGKGEIGFVLWLDKDGCLTTASDLSDWTAPGDVGVSVRTVSLRLMRDSGFGSLVDGSEMEVPSFPTEVDGLHVVSGPDCDFVYTKNAGKKWYGIDDSGLKVNYNLTTGLFSGTVDMRLENERGRVYLRKCPVAGVVLGSDAYGSVTVKNLGSYRLKICDCTGCDD